jgi:hypothetical protein
MDSIPFHIPKHPVPEPGIGFTYRALLFIEVAFFIERMFFVFNSFRGVNH